MDAPDAPAKVPAPGCHMTVPIRTATHIPAWHTSPAWLPHTHSNDKPESRHRCSHSIIRTLLSGPANVHHEDDTEGKAEHREVKE